MDNTNTIELGQSLELFDGIYKFVAFQSGNFKLRHELTDEYVLLTHVELSRLLRVPSCTRS